MYDPAKDTDVSSLAKQTTEESFTGEVESDKLKNGAFFLYKTAPFAHPTACAGPAMVDLFFKTTARDTDFFVEVLDVDEKGAAHVIGQPGKIRGSYITGVDKIRPLEPGRVYEAKIMPWEFAHEFKTGHRLGLMITSSMFPLYARNLGTAEPIATGVKTMVQSNQILYGAKHASSIEFHVLK